LACSTFKGHDVRLEPRELAGEQRLIEERAARAVLAAGQVPHLPEIAFGVRDHR
jgi:hypothetical protein